MRSAALSVLAALALMAAPAIAATPPGGTVDYERLWEALPLEDPELPPAPPLSAEPQGNEPASTEGGGEGGASAYRLIEYGLIAVGLGLIGAAFVRRRRERARRARSAAAPAVSEPPAGTGPELAGDSPEVLLEFAEGLSDDVLDRALLLFGRLHKENAIDAAGLSTALDCEPSELPAMLFTPIRRRARALDLPLPYEVDLRRTGSERVWRDDTGRATAMYGALLEVRDLRRAEGDTGPARAAAPTESQPAR